MDLYFLNNDAIVERLGGKIKELRIDVNMTQTELASVAGVGLSTIQSIEKGKSISLEKLINILRALRRFDMLDPFFAPKSISPIEAAKTQNVITNRKRVRK